MFKVVWGFMGRQGGEIVVVAVVGVGGVWGWGRCEVNEGDECGE